MQLVDNYNEGLQVVIQQNDAHLTISMRGANNFYPGMFLFFNSKLKKASKIKLRCLEKLSLKYSPCLIALRETYKKNLF